MELIHGLTGFKDLYHFDNDADPGRARHRHLRPDVGIQPDPPDRLHQERARLARRGGDPAARGRIHRLRAATHRPRPAAGGRARGRRPHRRRLSLHDGRSAQDDRPVRGRHAVPQRRAGEGHRQRGRHRLPHPDPQPDRAGAGGQQEAALSHDAARRCSPASRRRSTMA